MPVRKWYQDPKIAVPVLVALIGLVGTIVTVKPWKVEPTETPSPVQPEASPVPTPSPAPATSPVPMASPVPTPVTFPVVVIDHATGDLIAGARVAADEQGVSTETDDQGRCTLTVRPGQGKLRITVSRDGYQPRNVELTVFEGMDAARIRLQKI